MIVLRNRYALLSVLCLLGWVNSNRALGQLPSNNLRVTFSVDTGQLKPFQINSFKFYVSDLCLYVADSIVYIDSESAYLIDLSSTETHQLIIPNIENRSDSISIRFGLDSIKQISGVFEGDLDPIRGMYWTWNTGYIHYKLELEKMGASSSPVHYVMHLGGFTYPDYTSFVRRYTLKENNLDLHINIEPILRRMDKWKLKHLMKTGEKASRLSRLFVDHVKVIH